MGIFNINFNFEKYCIKNITYLTLILNVFGACLMFYAWGECLPCLTLIGALPEPISKCQMEDECEGKADPPSDVCVKAGVFWNCPRKGWWALWFGYQPITSLCILHTPKGSLYAGETQMRISVPKSRLTIHLPLALSVHIPQAVPSTGLVIVTECGTEAPLSHNLPLPAPRSPALTSCPTCWQFHPSSSPGESLTSHS